MKGAIIRNILSFFPGLYKYGEIDSSFRKEKRSKKIRIENDIC